MSLPQLTTPEFTTQLPSTNETIAFRPFLVKEEKVLLMAQQGKDQNEILNAVNNFDRKIYIITKKIAKPIIPKSWNKVK